VQRCSSNGEWLIHKLTRSPTTNSSTNSLRTDSRTLHRLTHSRTRHTGKSADGITGVPTDTSFTNSLTNLQHPSSLIVSLTNSEHRQVNKRNCSSKTHFYKLIFTNSQTHSPTNSSLIVSLTNFEQASRQTRSQFKTYFDELKNSLTHEFITDSRTRHAGQTRSQSFHTSFTHSPTNSALNISLTNSAHRHIGRRNRSPNLFTNSQTHS